MGVAVSLTPKAGLILGLANCVEMGFMGIAFSVRVSKCTGSALVWRIVTMLLPPISMLSMAILGALVGDLSSSEPILFSAFVSFGVVCLLAVACGDLLLEASHAEENTGQWWIAIQTLVGVYVVIVMDRMVS